MNLNLGKWILSKQKKKETNGKNSLLYGNEGQSYLFDIIKVAKVFLTRTDMLQLCRNPVGGHWNWWLLVVWWGQCFTCSKFESAHTTQSEHVMNTADHLKCT